jgi:hypothetical protein
MSVYTAAIQPEETCLSLMAFASAATITEVPPDTPRRASYRWRTSATEGAAGRRSPHRKTRRHDRHDRPRRCYLVKPRWSDGGKPRRPRHDHGASAHRWRAARPVPFLPCRGQQSLFDVPHVPATQCADRFPAPERRFRPRGPRHSASPMCMSAVVPSCYVLRMMRSGDRHEDLP